MLSYTNQGVFFFFNQVTKIIVDIDLTVMIKNVSSRIIIKVTLNQILFFILLRCHKIWFEHHVLN